MAGGTRESTWLVARRCLAIIRRVQRGPATREELVEAVLAHEGEDAYDLATGSTLYEKLRKDRRRIREHLYIDVEYDRHIRKYVLKDVWRPLLDLPDEDLVTIAWLERTFEPNSPQHDEVHALLGRLRFYLSIDRRKEIMRQREQIAVDLKRRDDDEIESDIEAKIADALTRRVRIAFDYYSPKNPDLQPRRHVVDPYERYFDTRRGHYYLKGYCHYADGPDGRDEVRSYVTYRLGRIENVQVLSNRLPPTPPPARTYEVVYELSSEVVGESVSRQNAIDIEEVEWRDDGSVLVRGTTESIFWAVQSLMHYRHHCKVLTGPEMVREMRKTIRNMANSYEIDTSPCTNVDGEV